MTHLYYLTVVERQLDQLFEDYHYDLLTLPEYQCELLAVPDDEYYSMMKAVYLDQLGHVIH